MKNTTSIFEGTNPFSLTKKWLAQAEKSEINDPNAIALATTDRSGMPNIRIVLLKEIEEDAFIFYTNYTSAKAQEAFATDSAAFVLYWKSLGRQIRVRGHVSREDGPKADAYYNSRPLDSRLGAWASKQSQPLEHPAALTQALEAARATHGDAPQRPPHWGGIRLKPIQFEFWQSKEFRLHVRETWLWSDTENNWTIQQLYP